MPCDSLTCACERKDGKGCLSVDLTLVRDLEASVDLISGMSCDAAMVDYGLNAAVNMVSGMIASVSVINGMELTYKLTCCPSQGTKIVYLEVDQPEIVWITIDTGIDYHVYSNTDWEVI